MTSFRSKITSAGSTLLKFTGIGAAVAGVMGAIGGLKSGISLAAELEQNTVAFETMLGSMDAAKGLMSDLTSFSASTPFQFPEIASSAKKLLAFGVGAADMTNKLTMLGDIAAGIGAPLEDIAAIYGKIKSRGQLTGETLNQMAERGIPIYRALAAELGVAESQIAGMVTKGQIGFAQVDAALGGLTKSGGQFSGMMAKQSQTLAGLWSTLTDNIGLALAGMVTTIIDAFNIRDVLKSVTAAVGKAGAWITAQVQRWAPVVRGVMQWIWQGIVGIWNAIYAAVAPIVVRIATWVQSHWQAMLQTAIGYWMSLYNAISAALRAAWTVVTNVASAIASAWTWTMELLGFQTSAAGATVEGTLDSMLSWWQWAVGGVTTAINTIAWSLNNFGALVQYIATGAAFQIVRFSNEVVYIFTDVIPGVLTWFANNWRDIFITIYNFQRKIWENMAVNVANFATALWGFLKGDGFNFQWTGLLTGFENTIKEMPKIAKREIGALEQSLGDATNALGNKLGKSLSDYLAEQENAAKDTADGIGKWFDDALKPPETPEPTPPKPVQITADTSNIEEGLADVESQANDTAHAMGLLVAGSAEAMQLAAQEAFAARTRGASVAAAPVASETRKAVQQAGAQAAATRSKNIVDNPVLAALNRLIELYERQPTLQLVGEGA